MSLSRNLIFCFSVIFLASCAQLESITGSGGSSVTSADVSVDQAPTQEDVLNQFSDVAYS